MQPEPAAAKPEKNQSAGREQQSASTTCTVFAVLEGLFGRCLITAPVVTLSHTKAGETDSWWFILLNMTDGSSYK